MKRKFEYWLGDDESLNDYHRVQNAALDTNLLTRSEWADSDESDILTLYGNTAVIDIQGSLLPYSNWLTRLYRMTGYPDIRNALVTAAENDNVDTILLNIYSSGGAAMGVDDISTLINKIKTSKKVVAYTDRVMASAAYWIGASAHEVYASRLSTVGSIGVITVHQDVTKQLDEMGIKVTVFRAGEFKALGGSIEALTPQAKAVIQKRIDSLYDEFVAHVAMSRNTSPKIVHDTMADGREFLGHEALDAGLIDGVMAIDDLLAKLQPKSKASKGTLRLEADDATDLSTNSTRTEASDMKKKILTPQAAAALAEGVELTDALGTAPDAGDETEQTTETEQPTETTEQPVEKAETETPAADTGLTEYLKAELTAANEKVMQLTIANQNLQTSLDAINATHAQMRTIVADATNNKKIALGGSGTDLSSLSDEALLQQHHQATADFSKTFPIGGRAALPSVEQPSASVTPVLQAGIRAVRTQKRSS